MRFRLSCNALKYLKFSASMQWMVFILGRRLCLILPQLTCKGSSEWMCHCWPVILISQWQVLLSHLCSTYLLSDGRLTDWFSHNQTPALLFDQLQLNEACPSVWMNTWNTSLKQWWQSYRDFSKHCLFLLFRLTFIEIIAFIKNLLYFLSYCLSIICARVCLFNKC